jgi:hypothetical protein
MPLFIAFAFLLIIPSTAILISNNSYFGTINLVYGQPDQMNSNVTNSLIIHNIPVKKVHVGDSIPNEDNSVASTIVYDILDA